MSQSFHFHIGDEESGLRVDEFLAARFGSLSRMRIASLICAGACLVNQHTAQAGWRVVTGDRVELALAEGAPTAMDPEPLPLEIVYEDSHLVVVVKPAGLLVHPTKNVKQGTLANALAYHLNRDFYGDEDGAKTRLSLPAHGEAHTLVRPGIVHRLDRATSGLMVIAKTNRALSTLSRHFHRRLVKKRYIALVSGLLGEDAGTIKARIGRDPAREPKWWVTESGKDAETRLLVRERFNRTTLVELEPVTGRTNQLRIHCAYSGHPIIGDEVYAQAISRDSTERSEKTLETEQNRPCDQAQAGLIDKDAPAVEHTLSDKGHPARLCLHAWRLAFHHPANGEWLEFASPLPEDFASVVERLTLEEKEP